jgi:hypothetical protein
VPDTMGRVVQLRADRQAVVVWLTRQPGWQDPTTRSWLLAEIDRATTADERTIQHMLTHYGIRPRRRKGTGTYPTAEALRGDVVPLVQKLRAQRQPLSADRVAGLLPKALSERQLRRLVKHFFDLSWEQFRDTIPLTPP